MKIIWNELIYGGQLHSIGVALMVYAILLLLNLSADIYFVIIVYAGIHSSYLYNRYKEYKDDAISNPTRTQHVGHYRNYIPYIILLMFLLCSFILLRFGNIFSFIIGITTFLVGISYSLYIKKFTARLLGLKNYFVAFSFSFFVFIFLVYKNIQLNHHIIIASILLFFFIFIRVFANTIFFDLKDIPIDKLRKLKTFPTILGITKTHQLIIALNITSTALIFIATFLKIIPVYAYILLLLFLYSLVYLLKSKQRNADLSYLSSLYADGEYLVIFILILIGKSMYGYS